MVNWCRFNGSERDWDQHVLRLSGGFYQTFGWGEVRKTSGWDAIRIIAKLDTKVVGIATVLTKRKLGVTVCWVPGGPVGNFSILGTSFKASLPKVVGSNLLYCRISLLEAKQDETVEDLVNLGWHRPRIVMSSGITMCYDLSGTEEERKARASRNWRHNLKRSERPGLKVDLWKSPDLEQIINLYREMELLKSLPLQISKQELDSIFVHCRENIILFRCLDSEGKLLAVRAAAVTGNVAMDLLAVASRNARKVYASHATLWALLAECHDRGLVKYDLSGVDPEGNKGVFDFKKGTGAEMVECLGEWEWSTFGPIRWLFNFGLKLRKLSSA